MLITFTGFYTQKDKMKENKQQEKQMNKEYKTTKAECQRQIDKLDHVCEYCGRELKPQETVDNAGNPTYWAGCLHGQGEDGWGHFSGGVRREVYDLAVKLVLDDSLDFEVKSGSDFDYQFRKAVKSACDTITRIEAMKNGTPRYTKNQLRDMFESFRKTK